MHEKEKVREIDARDREKGFEAVEKHILGFRNEKNRLKHNWVVQWGDSVGVCWFA